MVDWVPLTLNESYYISLVELLGDFSIISCFERHGGGHAL